MHPLLYLDVQGHPPGGVSSGYEGEVEVAAYTLSR